MPGEEGITDKLPDPSGCGRALARELPKAELRAAIWQSSNRILSPCFAALLSLYACVAVGCPGARPTGG